MTKQAYFFSHDANARHDPKMTAMRSVYGAEGYGWYWMLVEMMREADNYRLDMRSKYAFNAYAMQLNSESDAFASFVHDCINEFHLFDADGEHFWSASLLRRMEKKDEKSKKASDSANYRWENERKNANASESDAKVPKIDAIKESKEKKKDIKDIVASANANAKHTGDFEVFWTTYPNKKGKAVALRKWLSLKPDLDEVLIGTKAYIAFCQETDRLIKDGSTFVNNKVWEDEWKLTALKPKARPYERQVLQHDLSTPSDEEREHLERIARIQSERNKDAERP